MQPVSVAAQKEVACLAEAVYYESRGEPIDGQFLVAKTIVNRAKSNKFPNTVCSVVSEPHQFSYKKLANTKKAKDAKAWTVARQVAAIIYGDYDIFDGQYDDVLFYHAKTVRPPWSKKLTKKTTVKNHIFYSYPGTAVASR